MWAGHKKPLAIVYRMLLTFLVPTQPIEAIKKSKLFRCQIANNNLYYMMPPTTVR